MEESNAKKILITVGSSGIGAADAEKFLGHGWQVLVGDINKPKLPLKDKIISDFWNGIDSF